jgi:threonine dehydrogenase-like Zn-dependent dehydrogenase
VRRAWRVAIHGRGRHTKSCGVVSVSGVYAGFLHAFLFGDAFDKGLTFKMGQTHVQKIMPNSWSGSARAGFRPRSSSPIA